MTSSTPEWIVLPKPRLDFYGHTAVAYKGKIYVYTISSLYIYTISSECWESFYKYNFPKIDYGHVACLYENKMILHGGYTQIHFYKTVQEDTFAITLDNMKSELLQNSGPKAYEHSAVIYKDCMWVFGGNVNGVLSNQLYCLNLKTREWKKMNCSGTVPSPRLGHQAAIHGQHMYIINGWDGNYIGRNEFFSLNLESLEWRLVIPMSSSPPRCKCAAFVVHKNSFFMFGGFGGQYYKDLYEFSLYTREWRLIKTKNRPSERFQCTGTVWNNELYILGGTPYRGDGYIKIHIDENKEIQFIFQLKEKLNICREKNMLSDITFQFE